MISNACFGSLLKISFKVINYTEFKQNIIMPIISHKNIIKMFNFFTCMGSNPTAESFAYEVFNKVPKVPLGGLAQLIQTGNIRHSGGGLTNPDNFNTDAQNTGRTRGLLTDGRLTPQNHNGFDLSAYTNNNPKESVKGSDSNYKELVQTHQDSVIKKILKSNYAELLRRHKQKGGKWTDIDFPPDEKSIGNIEELPVKAAWKRIPQVIRNAQFMSDRIDPSDVLQGSIGDCYFLSAISALSQNEFRIKNLFPSLELNPYGIYMARILYNGVIRQVVVDDYIPVTPQNTPLFAKPSGGRQIWVMILEKCWAKLHGSYGATVGGLPNEVLHAFSTAPTYHSQIPVDKQKQQKFWNDMIKSHREGGILCCGTKSELSVEKSGLVLGHAYTILNLFEKPYRLIKLRNPWGKRQWTGRASEQDKQFWSKISSADKQNLGLKQANDGVFFMLWQDFVNYFASVDICKINDNASYLSLDFDLDKKRGQMFQFQVTQPGKVTVVLSQKSLRGEKQQIQRKGYSRGTIVVARHDQASKGYEYKYINSRSDRQFAQLALQLPNLQVGKYVGYTKIDWILYNPNKSTFGVYSSPKCLLKKSKQSSHDKFLYKTFLDHARKNSRKQILNNSPQQWICSDFLMNGGGYGYLAFHLDQKSKRKLGIQINEKQFTDRRLVLKKPYKGEGIIKTMVQPGKYLIILYRMKSQNYPNSITLPNPKIYNLV